jgi:hypothetical protein
VPHPAGTDRRLGQGELHAFIEKTAAPGVCVKTGGWSGYDGLEGQAHEPQTIGSMAAHIVLTWVHRERAANTPPIPG